MRMKYLFIVLVLVAAIALLALAKLLKGRHRGQLPYEKKDNLLTPSELKFLGVLDQVIGSRYRIMAQVRLADIIKVKSGLDNSTRSSAFNRIKAKHLDFVACDPSDMSIKFAIELDDSSHKRAKRMERDAFLEDAMESAGIPLHRFAVKREYAPQEIYDSLFGQKTEAL